MSIKHRQRKRIGSDGRIKPKHRRAVYEREGRNQANTGEVRQPDVLAWRPESDYRKVNDHQVRLNVHISRRNLDVRLPDVAVAQTVLQLSGEGDDQNNRQRCPVSYDTFCTMNPLEYHQLRAIADRQKRGNLTDYYYENESTSGADLVVNNYLYFFARYYLANDTYNGDAVVQEQMVELYSRTMLFSSSYIEVNNLPKVEDALVVTSTF